MHLTTTRRDLKKIQKNDTTILETLAEGIHSLAAEEIHMEAGHQGSRDN